MYRIEDKEHIVASGKLLILRKLNQTKNYFNKY